MQLFRTFIANWFEEEAAVFLAGCQHEQALVRPRVEHIRRVASLCRSLASEMNWGEDDTLAVEIIGFLHDIGRFSQYTKYRTFIDAESVSHTEQGVSVVIEQKLLTNISDYYRTIIIEGIKFHNSRNFKQNVHKKSIPFLRLIRDADKLEKYLTIADAFDQKALSEAPLSITDDGPVNPSTLQAISKCRKIPKKFIQSQLDYHLLQLSWIFEITFPQTARRIAEIQVIERIINILPATPEIDKATSHVISYYTGLLQNDS